ncbi:acyltransferase 3 [Xylariales sp. PMI_506]|nr:acyltransferase 3 [Xylariales sp. PMI_506]
MATSNNIISLRRHDLDNLRTFLTGLVTVHHTAIEYGGIGEWPFKSAIVNGPSALLIGINAIDQSFFMGLFFWISGRVSAQSLDRAKSPWAFIKTKFLRLGVPAIAYTLVLAPVSRLVGMSNLTGSSILEYLARYYSSVNGIVGPVWYPATLLFFDAAAAFIHFCGESSSDNGRSYFCTYTTLKKYGWLVVATSSFLIRTRFPIGTSLPVTSVQPGYLAQYIYAYTLGYLSYICNDLTMGGPFDDSSASIVQPPLLETKDFSPETLPRTKLPMAIVASALTLCAVFIPRLLDSTNWLDDTVDQIMGGWSLPSALYAIWNETSFALIAPALSAHFAQRYGQPSTSWLWSARYSYAAFLLHAPISAATGSLLDKLLIAIAGADTFKNNALWQASAPIALTASVGMLNAALSFALGQKLVDWVPGLNRIL